MTKLISMTLILALTVMLGAVAVTSTTMNVNASTERDTAQERCNNNLDQHIAAGGRHGRAAAAQQNSGICD